MYMLLFPLTNVLVCLICRLYDLSPVWQRYIIKQLSGQRRQSARHPHLERDLLSYSRCSCARANQSAGQPIPYRSRAKGPLCPCRSCKRSRSRLCVCVLIPIEHLELIIEIVFSLCVVLDAAPVDDCAHLVSGIRLEVVRVPKVCVACWLDVRTDRFGNRVAVVPN